MGWWGVTCWSVTSTRQRAHLAHPRYHPPIITYPLRPKGVKRWRWTALAQWRLWVVGNLLNTWAPLITGIPAHHITLRNAFTPSRNTGTAEAAAEQAMHSAAEQKGSRNTVCSWLARRVPGLPVCGPHRDEVPGAYPPLAVTSSLGNMLLFTGQASLNILCLIFQNVKQSGK